MMFFDLPSLAVPIRPAFPVAFAAKIFLFISSQSRFRLNGVLFFLCSAGRSMISCLSLMIFVVSGEEFGLAVVVAVVVELVRDAGGGLDFLVLVSSRIGRSAFFSLLGPRGSVAGGSVRGRLFRGGVRRCSWGLVLLPVWDGGWGGRIGVGAGGALFGCGEGTARCVVDSGVGVKEAGVGAGEGEAISISFPFLDLDFSLTVLAGFSGRATGFLLRGRGAGVWSLRIKSGRGGSGGAGRSGTGGRSADKVSSSIPMVNRASCRREARMETFFRVRRRSTSRVEFRCDAEEIVHRTS